MDLIRLNVFANEMANQALRKIGPQKSSRSGYEVFHGDVLGVRGQMGKWTSGLQFDTSLF